MGVRQHRRKKKPKPNRRFDDKRNAQIKHCWMRGMQRYGVAIGPEENARLVLTIEHQVAGFIERQSNNVTVWEVECQGKKIPVIYDKKRKVIVTCLPPEFMARRTATYLPTGEEE